MANIHCTNSLGSPIPLAFLCLTIHRGGLRQDDGISAHELFWYMNVALDRSTDCMKLYTLLFQLLPTLVLHDTRRLAGEEGIHGETNRSTIMERLTLAESGCFVTLIEKYLNAAQA